MTEPDRVDQPPDESPDEQSVEPSDEAKRALEHEQTDIGKEAPDELGGTGGEDSGGAG